MLGGFNDIFDRELHCLYYKVAVVRNASRIIEGEKRVGCEFVSKGVGNVARNEAADGGRDSKGTKFGGIRGIFV